MSINTDNLGVWRRAHQLLDGQRLTCAHRHLWADIESALDILRNQGCHVHIRKVKAHAEGLAEQDPRHTVGNTYADQYAGHGAFAGGHVLEDGSPSTLCTDQRCRCTLASRVRVVQQTDKRAWFILRRLAAVAEYLPRHAKAPPRERAVPGT